MGQFLLRISFKCPNLIVSLPKVAICKPERGATIVCQVHFNDFCEYRPDLIATAKTIKRTHS